MININTYITEKLHLNKDIKTQEYNYHPKDNDEFYDLVHKLIKERGNKANLNDIDVSNITSMFQLFMYSEFNGDISEWDVSNVTDMSYMFFDSKFNGDISEWDVSNITNMNYMFEKCPLEKNLPKWYHE